MLSQPTVIPACFWRESRKAALDNRLRGYDEKTLMQELRYLKAPNLMPAHTY